ncbi:MAG: hypothetical protein JO307_25070 [Bryobacterales bacterium]|nr:hypothetical protein [Bryobacterales bacterium]MBV9399237.1 hypothetical protein [Bryobacterales bacterium]
MTRNKFRGLTVFGLLAVFAAFSLAATMTMNGTISDSMCGVSHAKMIAGHPNMTDKDCTQACIKGGAKYVFVSNGKVYQITNQNFADLSKNAGEPIALTGDMTGDTVTVSKIVAEQKK